MSLTVLNIVLCIVTLAVLPVLTGNGVLEALRVDKRNIVIDFLWGMIFMMAICQVIAVPMVLFRAPFLWVVILLSIIQMAFAVWGVGGFVLDLTDGKKTKKKKAEKNIWIWRIAALCAVLFLILSFTFTTTIDHDDARFVVNVVDMVRTNKMYLTDPSTGNAITEWLADSDMSKDIAAPWAVYIATVSKVTGVYPTMMAHFILPMALLLLAGSVWYYLGKAIFKNESTVCLFIVMTAIFQIFGCYSIYTESTFLMTRLWQGKAVLATIGIPLGIALNLKMFGAKEKARKKYFYLLLIWSFACCLFSSMGVIIGALQVGAFSLGYALAKKDLKWIWSYIILGLPMVFYYAVYLTVKMGLWNR